MSLGDLRRLAVIQTPVKEQITKNEIIIIMIIIITNRIWHWKICHAHNEKQKKRQITEGSELSNQEKIRTLGKKENYLYLEILEADTIKQAVMKDKIRKDYLRGTRKFENKLYHRNLIEGINTWAVPLVSYSGPFLKWMRCIKMKTQRRYKKRAKKD